LTAIYLNTLQFCIIEKSLPADQGCRRRGIFSRKKNCRRHSKQTWKTLPRWQRHPIKNSDPGNRMAGEMKEGPGTMGSVAALWCLSGRSERHSAGESRGQIKSAFIKKIAYP
jgi:hypothetical protein